MIKTGDQVGLNKSKRVSALTNAYLPCIYYYLNWEIIINYWNILLKGTDIFHTGCEIVSERLILSSTTNPN